MLRLLFSYWLRRKIWLEIRVVAEQLGSGVVTEILVVGPLPGAIHLIRKLRWGGQITLMLHRRRPVRHLVHVIDLQIIGQSRGLGGSARHFVPVLILAVAADPLAEKNDQNGDQQDQNYSSEDGN